MYVYIYICVYIYIQCAITISRYFKWCLSSYTFRVYLIIATSNLHKSQSVWTKSPKYTQTIPIFMTSSTLVVTKTNEKTSNQNQLVRGLFHTARRSDISGPPCEPRRKFKRLTSANMYWTTSSETSVFWRCLAVLGGEVFLIEWSLSGNAPKKDKNGHQTRYNVTVLDGQLEYEKTIWCV